MLDVITIGTATRDVFLPLTTDVKTVKDPKHLKALGFKEGAAKCFPIGAKIDIPKPFFSIGGGATNTAVTFARQGLKTAAVISIGKDQNGKLVLEDLKKEKVRTIASLNKEHATGYSTLLLTKDGERTVVVYRGASNDLKAKSFKAKKLRARWAYIVPGAIPFKEIYAIVSHLTKQGTRIAINPSRHYLELGEKKLKPLLNKCSVVILNRSEAAELTNTPTQNEKELFQKLDKLVKGIAIMSEGPRGAIVSDGKVILRSGIFEEEALVDRLGAGDAFGSGFVAGLIRRSKKPKYRYTEKDLRFALRLASANATSVVEFMGAQTGIITKREFSSHARWKELKIKTDEA